ncbi:MAG: DUF2807 domain-containing protein, partial [Pedobacter sp.]
KLSASEVALIALNPAPFGITAMRYGFAFRFSQLCNFATYKKLHADYRLPGPVLLEYFNVPDKAGDKVQLLANAMGWPEEQLSLLGSGFIKPQGTWNVDQLECKLTGSGEIVGSFNADVIKLELGGSGHYRLSGNAEQAEYYVAGSGGIYAYGVDSRDAKVSVAGSGNCELSVSRKLNASVTGSGKIRYKGNPTDLEQNVTGSGRIEKQ